MSGKFCGGFGAAALGTWLYTTSYFISYLCAEAAARGSRVHNSSSDAAHGTHTHARHVQLWWSVMPPPARETDIKGALL